MNIQNLTPEEFYLLRDDRTNLLVENTSYQNISVRIIAPEETVQLFVGQVMILMATNLLSRWCRNISIGFSNSALDKILMLDNDNGTLFDRIKYEVSEADPFCSLTFDEKPLPRVGYVLHIGNHSGADTADFFINADNWIATASKKPLTKMIHSTSKNISGAVMAACIGIADAFKVAIGFPDSRRVDNVSLSLLDFSKSRNDLTIDQNQIIDLGNTQIIGIGSVGSAVLYLLRMLNISGQFDLIDHDTVEIVNLNRSPLFGVSDIGKAKVFVGKTYLQDQVKIAPSRMKYAEYISERGRPKGRLDAVLPLANEYGIRQFLENNLPPIQIYGTTTLDWGINYHRHIPLIEDCSNCRFPHEIPNAFVCSEGEIGDAKGVRIDAALPFLSVAAACLVVSDLLKTNFSNYPFTPNYLYIDFKAKMDLVYPVQRPIKVPCICSNRSKTTHESYITSTKYEHLSFP